MPPQEQTPEQNIPPVVTKVEPKHHNFIYIWLSLFILLILLGLFVFFYYPARVLNFLGVKYGTMTNGEPILNVVSDTSPDISTWKTYRNEEYGFELVLSDDWKGYSVEKKGGFIEFYLPTTYSSDKVRLFTISTTTKANWEEYLKCDCPRPGYLMERDNIVFVTTRHQDPPRDLDKQYSQINQILSTFNFIDQTATSSDISNWKTYRNEEYGFEFKYPSHLKVGQKINPLQFGDDLNYLDGIYVGGIVFFVANTDEEKIKSSANFNKYSGYHSEDTGDGPTTNCDSPTKVANSSVGDIAYYHCGGDGGGSLHGLIQGINSNIVLYEFPGGSEYSLLDPNYFLGLDKLYRQYGYNQEVKEGYEKAREEAREIFHKILSTFKFIPEKYKLVYEGLRGDGKLVEINPDGSEKILIPRFSEVAGNTYHSFNKLSFPENSNKLFLYSFLDGTDAPPGGIWEYNISSHSFKELPNVSKYYSSHGNKSLSPNGKYVATIYDPDDQINKRRIFILDLENDKVSKIIELIGNELVTFCSSKGDCWGNMGDLKWLDNQTLQYAVYDSNKYTEVSNQTEHPLIEKRTIKLK